MTNNEIQKKKKKRISGYSIKRFADVYQSTDEYLGEGACGTVRTFFSLEKRKEFAVKIIRSTNNVVRTKVLKEIEILYHCKDQENIVQLQEFFEEDQKFYLIFEKMGGGTLLDKLARDGPLPEIEVSKVIKGLAGSLKFLHERSVAHRDVKLENILCSSHANIHPVKLCDFDLSTEFSALRVNDGGSGSSGGSCSSSPIHNFASAVGSADYMAPEVVSVWLYEADHYTEQCDLWSLGVVMFILLSGLKPIVALRPDNCLCRGRADDYQCEYCKEEHFEEIKRGKYDMSGPEWASISQGAKDLVSKLLVVDPMKRFTPDQVLAHPWIVDPSMFRQPASAPIPCIPSSNKMKKPMDKNEVSKVKDMVNISCNLSSYKDGSRPSSWLSNYCGSEDEDDDGNHWIFVDHHFFQMELNDYDAAHEIGKPRFVSETETSGKLGLQETVLSVGGGGDNEGNNLFGKFMNDHGKPCMDVKNKDGYYIVENNKRNKMNPVNMFGSCAMKMLQFGSCDSGNMSGVSPMGSPIKF